jgi:hypothetical protein
LVVHAVEVVVRKKWLLIILLGAVLAGATIVAVAIILDHNLPRVPLRHLAP